MWRTNNRKLGRDFLLRPAHWVGWVCPPLLYFYFPDFTIVTQRHVFCCYDNTRGRRGEWGSDIMFLR